MEEPALVKRCYQCQLEKNVAEFHKNSFKTDGLQSRCKECVAEWRSKPENKRRKAEQAAQYYSKPENKRKIRISQLWKRYGVTLAEWDYIFENQEGCCAICKNNKANGVGWHTDHDHQTGKVRGILCGNCNTMIGMSLDNPAILSAGVKYLNKKLTR